MGNKRVKKLTSKKNEEDRISDLPDEIIQHILSFLPSTRQAVQATLLSKRWRNQWTQVPVLIFNSCIHGMSRENFLKFIDNALLLHDCSKIHKFHLQYYKKLDPQFVEKIRFATSKYVEDLNLTCSATTHVFLPEFLYNNDSLVKLTTRHCSFNPKGKVNWGCLCSLEIEYCKLPYKALENIVSGSPSLKSLKLMHCDINEIVIASKSLKRLFIQISKDDISVVEISCPTLVELSINQIATKHPRLLAQAIENVLSGSLLLESFELIASSEFGHLVIASNSLKKFVLEVQNCPNKFDIEISCPRLEELKLLGYLNVQTSLKLLNLTSSLCATIAFKHSRSHKACISLVNEIMQQFQQLKELKIGSLFLETLSTIKVESRWLPVLDVKCLTVDSPHSVKHHPAIAHLLHISPVLEKLVINVHEMPNSNVMSTRKDYWDTNADVFDCLVSHLKIIEIMGFPERAGRRKNMLKLVKFLLKNARVLEKMVVILKKDHHVGTYPSDISQELSSLPRCSQKAIIEVRWFF